MGVHGLTTYLSKHPRSFFSYNLENSYLVIDGNCLAATLHINSCFSTSSLGGDYDKFAKAVESFFSELLKCNVTPLVIFDGACEKKKHRTVLNRMKCKVISLESVCPSRPLTQCFPLMMRQVMRDVLDEMGIKFAQSDFEADAEIAALARKLNCPVLSNDSDFFIYDVLYLPLKYFPLAASYSEDSSSYQMICSAFSVDVFLEKLGGLPKSHLPLLAVLLGNDYINKSSFANFFSQIKLPKGGKAENMISRVKILIKWLKQETFDSAISKIFGHLKKNKKNRIARKVASIIESYTTVTTPLDHYLFRNENLINVKSDVIKSTDLLLQHGIEVEDFELLSEDEEDEIENPDDDLPLIEIVGKPHHHFPDWLVSYSRKGVIPQTMTTLLSLKCYHFVPLVEDYTYTQAGEAAVPIVAASAGLILGNTEFQYFARHDDKYWFERIPTVVKSKNFSEFPNLQDFHSLSTSEKKLLLNDIMLFCNSEALERFPQDWQIFLISVTYWINSTTEPVVKIEHIYSVVFMMVIVQVFCDIMGYFRNKRPFMQHYGNKLKKLNNYCGIPIEFDSFNSLLAGIPVEECLVSFENLIPFFHISEKLRTNHRCFSRLTVHVFNKLQTIISCALDLNSLLLRPYSHCFVHKFFNSTFLYNMSCFIRKRNGPCFVKSFFSKSPNLLNLFNILFEFFISKSDKINWPLKHKTKKKKSTKKDSDDPLSDNREEDDQEEAGFVDFENKFSILSVDL